MRTRRNVLPAVVLLVLWTIAAASYSSDINVIIRNPILLVQEAAAVVSRALGQLANAASLATPGPADPAPGGVEVTEAQRWVRPARMHQDEEAGGAERVRVVDTAQAVDSGDHAPPDTSRFPVQPDPSATAHQRDQRHGNDGGRPQRHDEGRGNDGDRAGRGQDDNQDSRQGDNPGQGAGPPAQGEDPGQGGSNPGQGGNLLAMPVN